MQLVIHRVNDVLNLKSVPEHFGVELDVQFANNELSIGHDPGLTTNKFEEYLKLYKHSLMCVNVKQEGIEESIIHKLDSQKITNYFLFDLSFPSIMKLTRLKRNNFALRVSDLESIRDLKFFRGKAKWIWLDTFLDINFISNINLEIFEGFKICLVSPELHTWRTADENDEFTQKILSSKFAFDAVCTKNPDIWKNAK